MKTILAIAIIYIVLFNSKEKEIAIKKAKDIFKK